LIQFLSWVYLPDVDVHTRIFSYPSVRCLPEARLAYCRTSLRVSGAGGYFLQPILHPHFFVSMHLQGVLSLCSRSRSRCHFLFCNFSGPVPVVLPSLLPLEYEHTPQLLLSEIEPVCYLPPLANRLTLITFQYQFYFVLILFYLSVLKSSLVTHDSAPAFPELSVTNHGLALLAIR